MRLEIFSLKKEKEDKNTLNGIGISGALHSSFEVCFQSRLQRKLYLHKTAYFP
jgi:hypothetical protein